MTDTNEEVIGRTLLEETLDDPRITLIKGKTEKRGGGEGCQGAGVEGGGGEGIRFLMKITEHSYELNIDMS